MALGRQGLHAFRLAFLHPDSGERVVCEAPLPADLRAALHELGLSSAA
jgi:23S rRNA pseudouridine1911/1915/1917 synthase